MKNTPLKLLLALSIVLGGIAPAFGQVKIATIDLRKVFDNYWKKDEADRALKETAEEMDKEFKTLADDYKKASEELKQLQTQVSDPAVSAEERERRKKAADSKLLEIRESEQTIDSFRRQASAKLEEQKRRMRDRIIDEIKTVVNAKAKTGGYTMVVDSSAESLTSTPVVVYNDGQDDITDKVLSQLNATAPAASTKPAPLNSDNLIK